MQIGARYPAIITYCRPVAGWWWCREAGIGDVAAADAAALLQQLNKCLLIATLSAGWRLGKPGATTTRTAATGVHPKCRATFGGNRSTIHAGGQYVFHTLCAVFKSLQQAWRGGARVSRGGGRAVQYRGVQCAVAGSHGRRPAPGATPLPHRLRRRQPAAHCRAAGCSPITYGLSMNK